MQTELDLACQQLQNGPFLKQLDYNSIELEGSRYY